jgi:CubicO group peptidase (beta-lactamase class C family)
MDASTIDGLLRQAASDGAVPGVIAVAGNADGVIYEGAFGARRVPDGEPVELGTMMWLASMTKAPVSVAALQLIEAGAIELEQPVGDILPAFAALPVLDGFDGDTPRLRPPARPATIRHLMTHTSGAGYFFLNEDLKRYYELMGIPTPATGALASLTQAPLVADPGTRWEYGLSSDWLGQVIEAVTGSDLAAYCAEHVFGPLGMTDTTFTPSAAQLDRMMDLHARLPDGSLVPSPIGFSEGEYFSGGAGLRGTAPDYLRFMRALLRGGELDGDRVLAPESVDLMFTDHLDGAAIPAMMRSTVPELTNDVPAWPIRQGWGLGLHLVLEDMEGMRRAGTGDWAGLTNSYFWIDRASGVVAALCSQVLPFFDEGVVSTAFAFEREVYAPVGASAVG